MERVENREDFTPLIPYDLGLVDEKFFHTYTSKSNGYTQIKTNSNIYIPIPKLLPSENSILPNYPMNEVYDRHIEHLLYELWKNRSYV